MKARYMSPSSQKAMPVPEERSDRERRGVAGCGMRLVKARTGCVAGIGAARRGVERSVVAVAVPNKEPRRCYRRVQSILRNQHNAEGRTSGKSNLFPVVPRLRKMPAMCDGNTVETVPAGESGADRSEAVAVRPTSSMVRACAAAVGEGHVPLAA